ncbi:hypothetical protein GCM10027404_17950 [Arthrobacter tumbae]|uniref:hypothetical protein n=1 Tax=Arthrobacter tumbae TaxID=163874 RepID=UPI00195DDD32|nr:hypothetical protein [Arthrobacter tumbae]MBM7780841.1 hypothetical protein [Arthrobacter tumbae]
MSEDFALLAAILRPRDVALHPNFRSSEVVTVASLLALLTTAQIDAYRRERESEGYRDLAARDTSGIALLDSALAGLSAGTVQQGANELAERARSSSSTPLEKTVCAVLSSSFFAELGKHRSSMKILGDVAEQISSSDVLNKELLLAVIFQNLALRRWDEGAEGVAEAQQAKLYLTKFKADQIPAFELSRGVAWGSQETVRAMHQFLRAANDLHFIQISKDWTARLELVRQASDYEALQLRSRVASGLSMFLEHSYRSNLDNNLASSLTDGDAELSEALMHAEFSGHLAALNLRKLLGSLRYLRGRNLSQDWRVEDALRLLRTSRSKKDFEYGLASIRIEGPLKVLRNQASRLISERPAPNLMDQLDFLLLESSSELLDPKTASEALNLVLEASAVPKIQRGRTWESNEFRFEYVWRAAIILARRADREAEIAKLLLQRTTRNSADHESIRLFDRLHNEVWNDESFRECVRAALKGSIDPHSELSRTLRTATVLAERAPIPDVEEDRLDLRRVAELLNLQLVQGYQLSGATRAAVERVLREAMAKTRESAMKGVFSGGGLPEGELAVVFGLANQESPIWTDVGEYLLDPVVQRSDKSPVYRRLLRHIGSLPSSFLDRLKQNPAGLLSSTSGFFSEDIDPYPEAVQLIAALSLLPNDELVVLFGRLIASDNAKARVEGVKTLQVLAENAPQTDWVFATAIGATFDADYRTRAEAAATLGYMRRETSPLLSHIDQRLSILLDEDGARIPMLALFGLRKTAVPMSPGLLKKVQALAATHIHYGVRQQAELVLKDLLPARSPGSSAGRRDG